MQRRALASIICTLLIASFGGCTGSGALSTNEVRQRQIIGELGKPLGTAVTVEATVIAGRELRHKSTDGKYLLQVTSVDGRPLQPPEIFEFFVPGSVKVGLVTNPWALYEMKTGKQTGSLDSEQIAELERGYVGRRCTLRVFETGHFLGGPDPDDGHPLFFETYLEILGRSDEE